MATLSNTSLTRNGLDCCWGSHPSSGRPGLSRAPTPSTISDLIQQGDPTVNIVDDDDDDESSSEELSTWEFVVESFKDMGRSFIDCESLDYFLCLHICLCPASSQAAHVSYPVNTYHHFFIPFTIVSQFKQLSLTVLGPWLISSYIKLAVLIVILTLFVLGVTVFKKVDLPSPIADAFSRSTQYIQDFFENILGPKIKALGWYGPPAYGGTIINMTDHACI